VKLAADALSARSDSLRALRRPLSLVCLRRIYAPQPRARATSALMCVNRSSALRQIS